MIGDGRRLPSERAPVWDTGGVIMSGDPSINSVFNHNPIRRSAVLSVVLGALLAGCLLLAARDSDLAAVILVAAAGLAALLLFTVLLLIWSVLDEGRRRLRRRISPDIGVLALPLRTENILRRAGYETLADLARLDDTALLSLRRMEDTDLRALRKALSLHHYRTWQDRGFPDR